jgi:membrane peptidoglycan carboxypeptidase
VTGVWVGNADYTPMIHTTGLSGAAPVWSQFMQYAVPRLTNNNPSQFSRPSGIVDKVVCRISGAEPSQWWPDQYIEVFAQDQPPRSVDQDLWAEQLIDTWSGNKASPQCSDFTDQKLVVNTDDEWAIKWIKTREDGENWALDHGWTRPIYFALKGECDPNDRPNIALLYPSEGLVVNSNPLDIYAIVDAGGDFEGYSLEIGPGREPGVWQTLIENNTSLVKQADKIYTLDLNSFPEGDLTLKLRVKRSFERYAERIIHFVNAQPTATPTATPTVTPTFEPTSTPTLTLTPTTEPSATPTLTPPPTP